MPCLLFCSVLIYFLCSVLAQLFSHIYFAFVSLLVSSLAVSLLFISVGLFLYFRFCGSLGLCLWLWVCGCGFVVVGLWLWFYTFGSIFWVLYFYHKYILLHPVIYCNFFFVYLNHFFINRQYKFVVFKKCV